MSSGAGRSRRSGHPPPRLCRILLGKRPGALAHLLDRQLDAPVDVRLLHVLVVGPGLLAGGRDRVRQVPEQLPDDVQGRAGVDPEGVRSLASTRRKDVSRSGSGCWQRASRSGRPGATPWRRRFRPAGSCVRVPGTGRGRWPVASGGACGSRARTAPGCPPGCRAPGRATSRR